MKSITPKALELALNIKKGIKEHYLGDANLIKILYEDEYDELEKYYYLTYRL